MMNLFSIFDPSTSIYLSLNWLSLMYMMLFLPNFYWFIPSRYNFLLIQIMKFLMFEFKVLLNYKENLMVMILLVSIFLLIMLNNVMGMFCYIYTPTSQLALSLSLSLPIWLSLMIYGWLNKSEKMFIHLVPQGTPAVLMPFMVLIESISNIIRPLTLAVRLSANMVAGHLLMTLISSTGNMLNLFLLSLMLVVQCMLIVLEISVAFIQAYVFTVLTTLYSSEI